MIIKHINLSHFRNYQNLSLDFSPQMNVFLGENAQGKTNILEAIYVLAMTKSHRTNKDREMIQWDEDIARISGRIHNLNSQFSLEVVLSKKGKIAKLNHLEQARLSTYIGHLNVIIFAPEDLDIVKGSPSVRRRFIDMELGQMSPLYLHHLTEYNRVLKKRNQYLKDMRFKKIDELYFDILSEQVAIEGAHVLKERLWFIENLENWSKIIHKNISNQKEDLAIFYSSSLDIKSLDDCEDYETIFHLFKKQLDNNRDREIDQGTTLIGPHRDDMYFHINGRNVQTYGSQGQQRTAALSIRLAEIDLMKELRGEYPVLLLDDVLSELDNERQTHLLSSIQNKVQTFLTTTSLDGIQKDLIDNPKIFNISKGQIETE